MTPTDTAAERLHALAWSTGEIAYIDRGRTVWQVDARRDGQTIVARAPTQLQAWQDALETAESLRQTRF